MRTLFFLPVLFLFACGNTSVPEGSVPELTIPDGLKQAQLTFQRNGNIVISDLNDPENAKSVARGSWPRWNADGTWVAFIQDNQIARVFPETGQVEMLSEVRNPRTLAVPRFGSEVVFSDGDQVKAVNVNEKTVRVLADDMPLLEMDIEENRVVGTQKILGGFRLKSLELDSGKGRDYGKGCSASFSPNGSRVTRNEGDHTRLAILDASTRKPLFYLPAPPGRKTDNQFWSTHPNWVVSMDEDSGHIYAHRISDRAVFRISHEGEADRPDLWAP